jgi:hypothetical protein
MRKYSSTRNATKSTGYRWPAEGNSPHITAFSLEPGKRLSFAGYRRLSWALYQTFLRDQRRALAADRRPSPRPPTICLIRSSIVPPVKGRLPYCLPARSSPVIRARDQDLRSHQRSVPEPHRGPVDAIDLVLDHIHRRVQAAPPWGRPSRATDRATAGPRVLRQLGQEALGQPLEFCFQAECVFHRSVLSRLG